MQDPCSSAGIPAALRMQARPPVEFQDTSVKLYRWYRPGVRLVDGRVSMAALGDAFGDCHDTSCNRSDLSEPLDVLYSVNGQHRFDHGVMVASYSETHERSEVINVGEEREYKLLVVHDPEECMYPHCLIQAYQNGVRLKKKPRSPKAKNAIRLMLRQCFWVHSEPDPARKLPLAVEQVEE